MGSRTCLHLDNRSFVFLVTELQPREVYRVAQCLYHLPYPGPLYSYFDEETCCIGTDLLTLFVMGRGSIVGTVNDHRLNGSWFEPR